MRNGAKTANHFAATGALDRLYALGGGSAVDLVNMTGSSGGKPTTAVLLSSVGSDASGYQEIVAGAYNAKNVDKWSAGWALAAGAADGSVVDANGTALPVAVGSPEPAGAALDLAAATAWATSFELAPNDRNFPCAKLTTGPNLPAADLEAYMTGVYASSPGNLCTYPNEVKEGVTVAQVLLTHLLLDVFVVGVCVRVGMSSYV